MEAGDDGSWSRAVAGFESLLGQGRARSEAGAADLALETKWEVVLFTGRGPVGMYDALVLNVLSLRHLGGGEVQGGRLERGFGAPGGSPCGERRRGGQVPAAHAGNRNPACGCGFQRAVCRLRGRGPSTAPSGLQASKGRHEWEAARESDKGSSERGLQGGSGHQGHRLISPQRKHSVFPFDR